MLFWWGEIKRSGRHLWCICPRGFLSLWVPVSLQRPVQWTTAAVTAHVMIQWRGSAAAVPLASLCSRTARPVKVKHLHSAAVTKLICHLMYCRSHWSFCLHLGLTGIIIRLFMLPPPFPLALFPTCRLFILFIDYHCLSSLTMFASLLVHQSSTPFGFSAAFLYYFLDNLYTTLPSSSFQRFGRASSAQAIWILQHCFHYV